jgi:hypothetical protein
MEKKTADIKAYQKAYRSTHPKDKAKTNEYMSEYIKKSKTIDCPTCNGKYKSYGKYKHDTTQKHIKALIEKKTAEEGITILKPSMASLEALKEYESEDEESDTSSEASDEANTPAIEDEAVVAFLNDHFAKSANPNRSAECKTPRVNKNLTTWKKVSKIVAGKSWNYLSEHLSDIVQEAYDKPSTQADTVVMLKLVLKNFANLSETDQTKLDKMNRSLKDKHIEKQTALPENGVSYAEMKQHENDENTAVALMMRLYNGEIPALRIHDYINAVVGKSETMNEIDLKKKVMIRRIKKNQKADTMDIIPLPLSLTKFIKKRNIDGALFGSLTNLDIDKLLTATFPGKKANPRYLRDLYSVEKTKTLSKPALKQALATMDHSALVHSAYYMKTEQDPLTELIVGK